MTYNEYLKDEYNRAKVNCDALYALCKSKGIDVDGDDTPTPEPTPEPMPEPMPEPTPEPTPATKEPEIINAGKSEYVLTAGQEEKFSVYVNNVSSSKDYIIEPVGNPTYFDYDGKGNKTNTGFRLDFDIKGKAISGKGKIKIYITKNPSISLTIPIIVK